MLEQNVVDPYVGQEAEGKKFDFLLPEAIKTDELKVFKFDSPKQLIITQTDEFSAVCPFSGLPDLAMLRVQYYPTGGLCIELKAFKYYMTSFRNVGIYQEAATKRIHDDLRSILRTDDIVVETVYKTRGGFDTTCIEGNIMAVRG